MHNTISALWLGIIAGTLCTLSFVPQVLRIAKSRNARDISLITFIMFSCGVFAWFIYGISIKEWPVIIANAVTLLLALVILGMKIKYG
jgi:MtN3 and saliva related transmembrane protein